MMQKTILSAVLAALLLATTAARSEAPADILGVPGPLSLAGESYLLAWTSAPTGGYVKQEYVPDGQTVERFDSMLLVEFTAGDVTPAAAGAQMAAALEARKESDPVSNYALLENAETGEVLIDFLLSGATEEGDYILEWNAYRYYSGADAEGRDGLLLLGISHRAYGEDAARSFLQGLSAFRQSQMNALVQAERVAL